MKIVKKNSTENCHFYSREKSHMLHGVYQIITELWPLIDVQNCVLLSIILTNGQTF